MNEISNVNGTSGAQPVTGARRLRHPDQPAPAGNDPIADQVEISEAGRRLSEGQLASIRQERIERIRAEIEAGTYETPDKLAVVVERLLRVLGG